MAKKASTRKTQTTKQVEAEDKEDVKEEEEESQPLFQTPKLDRDFFTKSLPMLFVGMVIWMLATFRYGADGWLGESWIMNALLLDRTVKIILGVVYSVLWLTVMTLAWKGKNTPAAVLFCVVAWLSGYLSSWVVDSAKNSLGEELAHTLFVRSTIIAVVAVATGLTIGLFASKWFKSGFRWVLSAFGMSGTLLQLGLTSMFGYEEGTFIASCIGFIWIAATIIFDGSRLPRQIGAGKWMQATAKIFLDLVTVLMKVFKLLVRVEKKKTKKTKSKVK